MHENAFIAKAIRDSRIGVEMTGYYGTQSDQGMNSSENLKKYRIVSIILIVLGVAFIAFHAFSMYNFYEDEQLFFSDEEQQVNVSHAILGIGWALWPIGLLFGIKSVIMKQGRSTNEMSKCFKYTGVGAVLIAAGWILLAATDWQSDMIDDYELLRQLGGSYYVMIGIGSFILGYGFRSGFKEMMEGSFTKKGNSYAIFSFFPLVGTIIYGIGISILGVLMIMDHTSDIMAYYSAMYLLRGIGLFVMMIGFSLAFHTSFKPGGRTTSEMGSYSRPGIVSILLTVIAASIILYSFASLSLLYYAIHTESRDLIEKLGEFSFDTYYYYLAIGYSILAAALPLAVWGGTSEPGEKNHVPDNPLFMEPNQMVPGAPPPFTPPTNPQHEMMNANYSQQTLTSPHPGQIS